jgi:hypothetical protein
MAPEPVAGRERQLGIRFPSLRNCVTPGTFIVKVIVVVEDFRGVEEKTTPVIVGVLVMR